MVMSEVAHNLIKKFLTFLCLNSGGYHSVVCSSSGGLKNSDKENTDTRACCDKAKLGCVVGDKINNFSGKLDYLQD